MNSGAGAATLSPSARSPQTPGSGSSQDRGEKALLRWVRHYQSKCNAPTLAESLLDVWPASRMQTFMAQLRGEEAQDDLSESEAEKAKSLVTFVKSEQLQLAGHANAFVASLQQRPAALGDIELQWLWHLVELTELRPLELATGGGDDKKTLRDLHERLGRLGVVVNRFQPNAFVPILVEMCKQLSSWEPGEGDHHAFVLGAVNVVLPFVPFDLEDLASPRPPHVRTFILSMALFLRALLSPKRLVAEQHVLPEGLGSPTTPLASSPLAAAPESPFQLSPQRKLSMTSTAAQCIAKLTAKLEKKQATLNEVIACNESVTEHMRVVEAQAEQRLRMLEKEVVELEASHEVKVAELTAARVRATRELEATVSAWQCKAEAWAKRQAELEAEVQSAVARVTQPAAEPQSTALQKELSEAVADNALLMAALEFKQKEIAALKEEQAAMDVDLAEGEKALAAARTEAAAGKKATEDCKRLEAKCEDLASTNRKLTLDLDRDKLARVEQKKRIIALEKMLESQEKKVSSPSGTEERRALEKKRLEGAEAKWAKTESGLNAQIAALKQELAELVRQRAADKLAWADEKQTIEKAAADKTVNLEQKYVNLTTERDAAVRSVAQMAEQMAHLEYERAAEKQATDKGTAAVQQQVDELLREAKTVIVAERDAAVQKAREAAERVAAVELQAQKRGAEVETLRSKLAHLEERSASAAKEAKETEARLRAELDAKVVEMEQLTLAEVREAEGKVAAKLRAEHGKEAERARKQSKELQARAQELEQSLRKSEQAHAVLEAAAKEADARERAECARSLAAAAEETRAAATRTNEAEAQRLQLQEAMAALQAKTDGAMAALREKTDSKLRALAATERQAATVRVDAAEESVRALQRQMQHSAAKAPSAAWLWWLVLITCVVRLFVAPIFEV